MPLPPLTAKGVVIGAEAKDWRAAVRVAGEALAETGSATPRYAEEMIRMIEEHGPYVVIAPGLALAHARPGPEVLKDGLAVVTLRTPVPFGHPHNDPVTVVLGLAAVRADTHLPSIAAIANIFNDPGAIAALVGASSVEQVLDIMGVDG
ncbi:PTS sugar transporter subunit IIA [Salinibacterium sp. SYSU T00001]|uniref:PTS sugar transporter subunit IIA n=1 Tax=Homoserinimonas sedimenticola TaxID=2986805 RepID=UPI002236293C|nr:PTS sugar transporter subunit IIA [Salinibacterium sedimenticola]MCW4385102.1 PTS sugar transporter subunit IIA [Salinibacterium sedimenticola]